MGTLLQDVRYGFRMMWKRPGFTLVAALAIALGVGAVTTVYSAVDVLLLNPFSFERPDRVLMVWEHNVQSGFDHGEVAPANFNDARTQLTSLENLSAFYRESFNMSEGERAERVEGSTVTPAAFQLVAAKALHGRTLSAEDEEPGRDRVVVLGYGFWQRRFGGDPAVVNRQLKLNGASYIVVGVMPRGFSFPPNPGDLWVPLAFTPQDKQNRGNHYMRVAGRLREGVTQEEAQAELTNFGRQLEQQYPDTNAGRTFALESLITSYTRGPRPFLTVLLGAVAFVLLLACANVANLLLVRASGRQKEVAIRMALGASRARLVRQFLTESVMLALLGGAVGLLLAVWGIDLMKSGVPESLARFIPNWENVALNRRVLLVSLGITVATGLLFGLAPALQSTKANFNEDLKEGGRTSGAGGRSRLRSLLVVSEVTLSLVLLIGAGLMIRSFVQLLEVEPGFRPTNLLVADVSLSGDRYKERQPKIDFYQQLVARLKELPGVERAGAVNIVPLSRSNNSNFYRVKDEPELPKGKEQYANWRPATPGYLEAMNIPLRRGRYLEAGDDRADAPRVLLINEYMARRHFADQDPLGKQIDFGDAEKNGYYTVVGVVGNVRTETLDDELRAEVYVPYAKSPWSGMTVVARTSGDPSQLAAALASEVRALDPDLALFDVRTMDRVVAESLAPQRVTMGMLGVFALIALVLAAIGIYAVMSYTVAQRTHEIGIRMALGAQPRNILRMIVGHGMLLAGVGIAVGLTAAYFLMAFMARILYGVTATDPLTFFGISALLALVALAANFFPARRATRVDPMVALRYE